MMQCPRCQGAVSQYAVQCPECGHRVAAPDADPASRPLPVVEHAPPPGADQQAPSPGSDLALASTVCSLVGTFLLTTCVLAPLSVVPLLFGAFFGALAMGRLPVNAKRSARTQAQFGMWIGVAGSAFALLVLAVFGTIVVLGLLDSAAT